MYGKMYLSSIVICAIFFNNYCVNSGTINRVYKNRGTLPISASINKKEVMSSSIIESVTSGTFLALEHCQNVFQWDRWNCPREEFARHSQQPSNREAAFTKAIVAAGIVHSITRNCSRGDIKDCGCDSKLEGPLPQPPHYYNKDFFIAQNKSVFTENILLNNTNSSEKVIGWSWGGCSDDTSFGIKVAKELLENSEKNLSVPAYVGRHNYKVGREIVRQTMVKKCRCHGVSGSCSLQTCWMQVVQFQQVARKLREKYTKATRLTKETVEGSISFSNSIKREEKDKHLPASEHTLVYLEQSPDYCIPNAIPNWPGTKGRSCSKSKSDVATLSERKSCRNLCRQCGYKVRKERRTIKKRCNCSFKWCCVVKCDTCLETVEEFYCY